LCPAGGGPAALLARLGGRHDAVRVAVMKKDARVGPGAGLAISAPILKVLF
jgi:hypothetical protein